MGTEGSLAIELSIAATDSFFYYSAKPVVSGYLTFELVIVRVRP